MPIPKCIRLPFDDSNGRDELLASGWREIEILETWAGPISSSIIEKNRMEFARNDDLIEIQKLAMGAFTHDRLHADHLVPKADADGAKAKWVATAFDDKERTITVTRLNGGIGGFLVYKSDPKSKVRRLIIDLLAIDDKYRRHGLATQLVVQSARAGGFRQIKAGTQSTNEPARKFYKSLGMRIIKRQRTFHHG